MHECPLILKTPFSSTKKEKLTWTDHSTISISSLYTQINGMLKCYGQRMVGLQNCLYMWKRCNLFWISGFCPLAPVWMLNAGSLRLSHADLITWRCHSDFTSFHCYKCLNHVFVDSICYFGRLISPQNTNRTVTFKMERKCVLNRKCASFFNVLIYLLFCESLIFSVLLVYFIHFIVSEGLKSHPLSARHTL